MVEKFVKQNIQTEERVGLDLSILKKRSSGKTASGICLGYLKKLKDSEIPLEYKLLIQNIYRDIKDLEVSEKIYLENWKGKSSLKIIEKPDKFTVITWQRKDQDSEPHEVKREITKQEVNEVIFSINKLDKGEKISTRDIGELTYKKNWDEIFSDRFLHQNLNAILHILDYYKITIYRGRYSKVLKQIADIQTIISEHIYL